MLRVTVLRAPHRSGIRRLREEQLPDSGIVEPARPIHDRLLCDRRPTPAYCSFDLRRLLGHKLRDAERLAHSVGFHLRVIERDRHRLAGDLNFDTGRVDVATESGIVTEIRGIG